MKVAIVTSFPRDPAAPQGGVEAVSVNLTQSLAEIPGLDVHVVTVDTQLRAGSAATFGRAKVHRLPGGKGSTLLNAIITGRRTVCNFLRELYPDVVHSHDTYGLMVKGLALPRIFTVHGFIYADTLVSGSKLPRLRSRIWKMIETAGWADQPHIIAISPYVRERVSGVARGVIHDIENPVSEAFFTLKRKEDPGIVFSSAVISPRKNTLALIEAFKIVADEGRKLQLRLAGRVADPGYGRLVEERIQALNIRSKVSLLGAISSQQVRSELSRAAVYALVSLEENAPMGIEEAMAAGVPVLASNRCGMPFMVSHGETGFLVDPEDTFDIAARLRLLLDDQSLRETMAVRARALARERYHPQKVALRTRDVYEEAIRSSHFASPRSRRFDLRNVTTAPGPAGQK
jgi:glycosyltransferase involved in cell wall biosynthesis